MNKIPRNAAFTSLALASAPLVTQANDVLGKDFTIAFPTNYNGSGSPTLYLSAYSDSLVTIRIPGLGLEETLNLVAGEVGSFELPQAVSRLGQAEVKDLGVFVESTEDISVFGMTLYQYTTDGFNALPTDVLGHEYYILSYYPLNKNNWKLDSEFVVVAAQDDTVVQIVPSVSISAEYPAGQVKQVTLNKGQTIQLSSYEEDVSGTFIRANKPIAVYGAHECADVPSRDSRIGWCDYLVESMIPTENWGFHYDLVPLATRLSGDIYRVIAAEDSSEIVINGQVVTTLNAGEIFEETINGPMSVSSAKPIFVAQYAMGQGADGVNADPFMMNIVPFQQFLKEYLFTTPADGFVKNFVNVVIERDTTLMLDGSPLDTSHFNEIPGSDYLGGQVSISVGQHQLIGNKPFGTYVYGFNAYDSYGYPAGQAFGELRQRADKYAPNISALKHIGHQIVGQVADSEDANADGILDSTEDLNSNGFIDGRSEDTNLNGQLDSGEDLDGDGIIASDSGFFTLRLADGADNVALNVRPVTSSRYPLLGFSVQTIDFTKPGSATLIAEDLFGNQTSKVIDVPAESALVDVKLVSSVSGDRLIVDESSFSHAPDSVVTSADGLEITWTFDKILSNEIETISYDLSLLAPKEGEQRLVTRALNLSYINSPNGDRKVRSVGPQSIKVLSSAFNLGLTANSTNIGPQSQLQLTSSIENLSETAFDAQLQLTILDPEGVALVSETIPVPQLDGGATTNVDWNWNSGDLFTGNYIANAKLVRDGNVVNETEYQFQIFRGADIQYPLAIDTETGQDAGNGVILDQEEFNPTDIVPITINIENITSNELFNGGRAVTQLTNSSGVLIEENQTEISALAPGSALKIRENFTLSDIAPGQYTVTIFLYDAADNLVGVTTYSITVVANSNAAITGDVIAQSPEILRGDSQHCLIKISNSSAREQNDVPVSASILNVSDQIQSDSMIQPVSVQPNNNTEFEYVGSTAAGVTAGEYACLISTQNNGVEKTLDLSLFNVYNLIANPGPERTLQVGDTLSLDATLSREADGLPLTYQWTLISKPENSDLEIVDQSMALQTFEIDQQGDYIFELIVNNGSENSLPKRVAIHVTNRLPNANAGPDQLIALQQWVQLNGLDTTDLDNDLLEFSWQFISKPAGSSTELAEADTGTPSFLVDVEGVYIAQMTVVDDAGGEASDQVILSAGNLAPVADAGTTISGQIGDRVTLDGSGSYDVNGDALEYDWQLVSKPSGSDAILINGRSARPFFDIDVQGDYIFELQVSDGVATSAKDQVLVRVGNIAPVANAGPDSVFAPYNYIYLDGSASSDADGDAIQYKWSIISTPRYWYRPTLYNSTTETPYFYPGYSGDYVIQLRVFDGKIWSDPDTVRYSTKNVAPSVNAYLETYRTIYSGDQVNLSAYVYDSNNDSVTVTWELIEKPEGSLAVIDNPNYYYPSFIADEPGDYVAQVTASDGELTDVDTVYIYGAEACIENLDIRPKDSKIQLTWTYDDSTSLVDIYRSTSMSGPYEWIADTTNTYSVYIDEAVNNGTQYYYRFEREYIAEDGGEYGGGELPSLYGDGEWVCDEYGEICYEDGYGDYGDYYYYESCESQIISSIPERRVRYNLVPDLRGLTLEEAEAAIVADGFTLGTVTYVRTTATEEGLVLQQDAPRNSRLPRNSEINLFVATW